MTIVTEYQAVYYGWAIDPNGQWRRLQSWQYIRRAMHVGMVGWAVGAYELFEPTLNLWADLTEVLE